MRAYYSELNLKICNHAQKLIICRKKVTTRSTMFVAIFALAERLPTSTTLRWEAWSLGKLGAAVKVQVLMKYGVFSRFDGVP